MQQDFVALQWVNGEIGLTAEQLQRELLGFADNLSDPTRLRHALTLAHQMHATLRMLGIASAELLARELEGCVQAMLHGRIPSSEANLQILLAATLQLPAYLRRVALERRELPFDVHTLVNELRVARGDEVLPPPEIDRSVDTSELTLGTGDGAEPATEDELQLLRKARQRLQGELLGLLRGETPQEHLRALGRVFGLLVQRLRPGGHRHFWQGCAALCDAVVHGGIGFDERIRDCVRDIDAELRAGLALEQGFYTRPPGEPLYRQLLEIIALSRPATPVLAEIQQRHHLIPDRPGDTSGALEDLGATDAAVSVIAGELARVLEQLETTEGSANSIGRVLREVEPDLRRIASLLAGLGYREEHEVLAPQLERISSGMPAVGAELEDRITEITTALLDVDQRLAARALDAGGADTAQAEVRQHPLARARAAVCREVQNGIEQTKQAITDYASASRDLQLLAASPARLRELWGALRLAGLDGAAHVVGDCRTYLAAVLDGARDAPGEAEVEAFADALSSIEYFVERLLIDKLPAELILVRARESMRRLVQGEALERSAEPVAAAVGHESIEAVIDAATPLGAPPLAEPELPEVEGTAAAMEFEVPAESEAPSPETAMPAPEAAAMDFGELAPVEPAAVEPEGLLAGELPELSLASEPVASEPAQAAPALADIEGPAAAQPAAPEPAAPEPVEEEGEAPDPEIVEIFVEEATEVLQTIGTQFPLWRATPAPGSALNELRRAFHTLKGSGRMVGANVVGELAWSIENLLNRVIDRTVAVSPDVLEAMERARALLPGLVESFAARTRVDMAPVLRVQEAATALARGLPVRWEAEPEPAPVEAVVAPAPIAPEPEPGLPAMEFGELAPVEPAAAEPEAPLAEELPELSLAAAPMEEPPSTLYPGAEHEAELEDWLPELEPEEIAAAVDAPAHAAADGFEPARADERLLEIFAEEAAEHLVVLRDWLDRAADRAVGDRLMRSLHTLRGGAHAAGIDALGAAIAPLDDLVRTSGLEGLALDASAAALVGRLGALLEELVAGGVAHHDSDWRRRAGELQAEAAALLAARVHPAPAVPIAEPRVARFLEEALQSLFHATTLLDAWREAREPEASRTGLVAELQGIRQKAEQLNVNGVLALVGPLLAALAPVERGAAAAPALFDTLKQGVEACLDVLDRIAAGQLPDVPAALVAALGEFAAVEPPAPAAALPAAEPAPVQEALRVRVARDLLQAELELLDIFLEEAEELMAAIDEDIDSWRHDRADRAPFENLQRSLHTLKGGARMAGLRYLGELAHNFETFLINQGVHFGSFDDKFFTRVADFHEQLAQTMDVVRERPSMVDAAPAETATPEAQPPVEAPEAAVAPGTPVAAEPPTAMPEPTAIPEPAAPVTAAAPPLVASAAPDADALRRSVAQDLAQAEFELLGIFLEEAEELMASIDAGIDTWRGARDNREPFDRLQRDLHTLKGGARMAGLRMLGNLAHDFETMLIAESAQFGNLDDAFFARVADFHEQLARVMDVVKERPAVEAADAAPAPPAPEPVAVPPVEPSPVAAIPAAVDLPAARPTPAEVLGPLAEIPRPPLPPRPALPEGSIAIVAAKPPAPAVPAESRPAPAKARDEVVRVSAQLLEDLVNLAGETSISRGRVEEQVSELGKYFDDMQATIERLQGQVRRLDIATEAQILFRRERAESEGAEGFDPLEMDRYSQLQQLSRSLVESASDLLDIKRTLAERTRDLETVLIQQSRINSQLQEGLMRSRMVPFSSILPRIKRVVRQVAQELDKSVELELGNMAGELDRGILERVVAPLEHMLRNAVDHGIESKDKRHAAGKPVTGRILIEIARDGGDVLIAVSDDGAGVNLAAVRAKAIERGLMEADSQASDHEVVQFILHSGFSTAARVTQISGRGVGMDVVSSEIRQMGGSLEIHSTQGQGSRFTIRLPFTVSVSRALLVASGTDIYALPLSTVEGVVRMRTEELARYAREQSETFHYAGQSYRVDYLGALLHPGEQLDLSHLAETVPVVLVRGGGQSLAVEVDRLIGAREIVVKSLGPQFGAVPGLSGATVLGDGSVVLIIDVPAMLRADAARGAQMDADARRASRGQQAARAPLVMVVDDSVTVRKVTTRFLEREGMRVLTAKDGVEAMVMLQERVPDLMLLDIEMPHMDGFEVVSKVRLSEQLKHLPIIMITSRTGEKHRERALSLGANMYLGKPYQESVLIEHINALLKRHEH